MWGLFAALLLLGFSLAWRRRHPPAGGEQWLATREGLVCVTGLGFELYPWEQITSADGHELRFEGEPEVSLLPGIPPIQALQTLSTRRAGQRVRVQDNADTSEWAALVADSDLRSRLPAFRNPEGPPEAVLAGLGDPPFGEHPR